MVAISLALQQDYAVAGPLNYPLMFAPQCVGYIVGQYITHRVQLGVYGVSASWCSEPGQDTPSRYLAIGWNTCNLS